MTKTVDRRDFEKSPGQFLDFAAAGNEVVITEQDYVRARLISPRSPRKAGLNRGSVQISDDFDAPLPDEFWQGSDK